MMEKEHELVAAVPRTEGEPRDAKHYLKVELKEDISVFTKNERKMIEQFLDGKDIFGKEKSILDIAINKWWENKYGFPFVKKAARSEVLLRKYAEPKEIQEVHELQHKLLEAMNSDDQEAVEEIKREYQDRYPDQLEGVEVLFGLSQFLKDEASVAKHKGDFRDIKDKFKGLTEYNFLITHFINQNSGDKQFLNKFWSVLRAIAQRSMQVETLNQLQRCTATQVAAQKIFEQIGLKPRLSHPNEDAFHAIDLWTDTAAIQVKGTINDRSVFLEADTIAFPGIEISKEKVKEFAKTYHITTWLYQKAQRFQAKLSKYREFSGKDIKGYFLVIHYEKVDFITGEPDPELVRLVKERLETELK